LANSFRPQLFSSVAALLPGEYIQAIFLISGDDFENKTCLKE
jgi:hypothetical protein